MMMKKFLMMFLLLGAVFAGLPTMDKPILNSTTSPDIVNETANLTLYPQNVSDPDNDTVYLVPVWYVDNETFEVFYAPFEANSTKDYAKGKTATITGDVVWNATGGLNGSGAYTFAGADDVLKYPDNGEFDFGNGTQDFPFSISLWMNPAEITVGEAQALVSELGTPKEFQLYVYRSGSAYLLYMRLWDASNAAYLYATANLPDQTGVWTHVVATYDGSGNETGIKLYVNGVEATTGQMKGGSAPYVAMNSSNRDLHIGGEGGTWFNGTIDEVKIFRRELSPEQVAALYNQEMKVVSNETNIDEVWWVCLTATDQTGEGETECSNRVLVRNVGPSGSELPSYIEQDPSGNAIADGKVWTKLNLTAGETQTIYVYYGGSVNKNNGSAVFEWFDDFTGGTGNWTGSGYTISSGKMILTASTAEATQTFSPKNISFGILMNGTGSNQIGGIYVSDYSPWSWGTKEFYRNVLDQASWKVVFQRYTDPDGSQTTIYGGTGGEIASNKYTRYEINYGQTNAYFRANYSIQSTTTNEFEDTDVLRYTLKSEGSTFNAEATLAYVRKFYEDAEINITYGSEETGSWTIGGQTYSKRKEVNITSNMSLQDYQVALDYAQFNDSNLTVVAGRINAIFGTGTFTLKDTYETTNATLELNLSLHQYLNASDYEANFTVEYDGQNYTFTQTANNSMSFEIPTSLVQANTSKSFNATLVLTSVADKEEMNGSGSHTVAIAIEFANITYSPDPAIEGQNATVTTNFNIYEPSAQINLSGTIEVDGSNSTASCDFASGSCSVEVWIPSANAFEENKSVSVYWTKASGSSNYSYDEVGAENITTYMFLIGNCNATLVSKLAEWYLYDELNKSNVTGDSSLAFTYTVQSSNITKTKGLSFSSATNFSVCVYPSWGNTTFIINSTEDFSATGYTTRHRYMRDAEVSTQMSNISIYLLPSSSSTQVTFSVVEDNVKKTDVDVEILKFFTADSSYFSLGNVRIGSSGEGIGYVDTSGWYKFKVYSLGGSLLYESSSPEQIVCTTSPCTYEISYYSNFTTFAQVPFGSSCVGNKTANTILCDYTDTTGRTHGIRFVVKKSGVTVCESNITGSSGQMLCDLTAKGENLSTYVYEYYIFRTASPEILASSGFVDLRDVQSIFSPWIVAALALITVAGLAFYFHPGLSVAVVGMGVFAAAVVGVFPIGLAAAASILMASLVIAWRISR